jgi:hypothetical protein
MFVVKVKGALRIESTFKVRRVGHLVVQDATDQYYRAKSDARCPLCASPAVFSSQSRVLCMRCPAGCELNVPIDTFVFPWDHLAELKREYNKATLNESMNKLGKLYGIPVHRAVNSSVAQEYTAQMEWAKTFKPSRKKPGIGSRQRQLLEMNHF